MKKKIILEDVIVDGEIKVGKKCRICGVLKPLEDYHKHSNCVGGRDNRCKSCERERLGYVKTIKRSKVVKEVNKGKEVISKICTKCDLIKPISEFNNQPDGLLGKDSHCRECKTYYREENKGRLSEKHKEYYKENADNIKQKASDWYYWNYERARKTRNNYYKENKEELLKKNKIYRTKNQEQRHKK